MSEIQERASFELVRYANVWEDAEILLDGLAISPGARILSVASAGDNSFALLARQPGLVVAADISGAQLALVELKRAAIMELEHPAFLEFLGFRDGGMDRVAIYQSLRGGLGSDARAFWDRRGEGIAAGVIHGGKFERYFTLFRRRVLPLVHRRRDVLALMARRTREERERFYDQEWDTVRWRLMFRIFFSEFVMGRMGRDPEFFRYVEGGVARRILERVRYALTALPTHDNPYIAYILTGTFGDALPFYAKPENFRAIRENMKALELYEGPIEDAAARFGGKFDGCNLSDIFEYMDPALFREVAGRLLESSAPDARLAYWNMLVPRRVSEHFPDQTEYLRELSEKLFMNDRAFFYQTFIVDRVTG